LQAGRIIAQLLVSGGMIVFRAAAQAYQQALISALSTPAQSERESCCNEDALIAVNTLQQAHAGRKH
jgi:hypothetical protein